MNSPRSGSVFGVRSRDNRHSAGALGTFTFSLVAEWNKSRWHGSVGGLELLDLAGPRPGLHRVVLGHRRGSLESLPTARFSGPSLRQHRTPCSVKATATYFEH